MNTSGSGARVECFYSWHLFGTTSSTSFQVRVAARMPKREMSESLQSIVRDLKWRHVELTLGDLRTTFSVTSDERQLWVGLPVSGGHPQRPQTVFDGIKSKAELSWFRAQDATGIGADSCTGLALNRGKYTYSRPRMCLECPPGWNLNSQRRKDRKRRLTKSSQSAMGNPVNELGQTGSGNEGFSRLQAVAEAGLRWMQIVEWGQELEERRRKYSQERPSASGGI